MILIITHKEDFTADFLINKLNKESVPYVRYNTEDILFKNDINLFFNENKFSLDFLQKYNISSVWFRRIKLPNLNSIENNTVSFIHDEVKVFFEYLWDLLNVKWLSNPRNIYKAENKFLQLREAHRVGLKIPNTLISSNKDIIAEFFYENKENIIVKPIYGTDYYENNEFKLIYTNKITSQQIDNLNQYIPLPCIYQENVSKEIEIRATVVGNEIFSAYVDSQNDEMSKIDWRRKRNRFFKYELPLKISEKCIRLVKNLGLSFGAIDIIKSQKGEYIFLEINPNGQWAWIEIDTNLPIAKSIINFLTN